MLTGSNTRVTTRVPRLVGVMYTSVIRSSVVPVGLYTSPFSMGLTTNGGWTPRLSVAFTISLSAKDLIHQAS